MTKLVMRRFGGGGFEEIDLLTSPWPTVMNEGIAGVCRRGWQYWIEGGGHGPLNRVPHEGATEAEDPVAFRGDR